MKKIMSTIAFCTIIPFSLSQADYFVTMPLEKVMGGHLQDGSIQFVSNEPVFDTPDPLPTEEGVTCKFNLNYSQPVSAYLVGKAVNGSTMTEIIFENQLIINGFKGKLIPDIDPSGNYSYYETCVLGQPIYNSQNDNLPDQEWDQDNCRYNSDSSSSGPLYYWRELLKVDGTRIFLDAKLGSFGSISYNSTDIVFPSGTINNTNGKILPDVDSRIIKGKTAFYKGNYGQGQYLENGDTIDLFTVCKKTAK